MKILLTAAGSYGDIAPYTGVGARLRAAGHDVTLAAHDTYAPLAHAAGLHFRGLPADPRTPGRAPDEGPADAARQGRRQLMHRAAAFIRQLGDGLADAVESAPGTELLLLSTTTAPLGRHLAEALDIPSLHLPLQPTAPTAEFAPVLSGGRSLGRWGNRAAGHLSLRVVDRLYADAVRDLRARLTLPPATPRTLRRRRAAAAHHPVLHGFSEALLPRPADWAPNLRAVGNWWPWHAPDARLPDTLEDFLGAGPPPVFIGFGSMASGHGDRLSALAVRALRRAGLRGVLQSGWAGLTTAHADAADILTVDEIPHALLFPRVAAVVHHCGAGTAAAGLRAGVPTVPVPVTADQPFWAARLVALGAATAPLPLKSLTTGPPSGDTAVTRLADALTRATTDPAHRESAARAAHRMAGEDGTGAVLEAVTALRS